VNRADKIDELKEQIKDANQAISAKKGFITTYINANKDNHKSIKGLRKAVIDLTLQLNIAKNELESLAPHKDTQDRQPRQMEACI
jgi:hypothetical protein